MKLNLLPTTVSREKTARRAWVVFAVLVLAGIGISAELTVSSQKELNDAKAAAYDVKPKADEAKAIGDSADGVIAQASPFVRNVELVKAVDNHLPVYPEFYAKLKPYIPNFFRVISMQAAPIDANTVTVTMTGVIKSEDRYHDLVFALLRIPTVTTVTRTDIPHDFDVVPPITALDSVGRIHKQSEPPIPDDIDARINQLIAKGGVSGFLNQGNFGTDQPGPKGAMPNYNQVTVAFNMPGHLLAPNIRDVIASIGSAPASTAAAAVADAATSALKGGGAPKGGGGGPRRGGGDEGDSQSSG